MTGIFMSDICMNGKFISAKQTEVIFKIYCTEANTKGRSGSYDLSVSFVLGRPITQRLFLFGLSYQVILHSCVLYLAYVTLNNEMKHVRGNGYGLF